MGFDLWAESALKQCGSMPVTSMFINHSWMGTNLRMEPYLSNHTISRLVVLNHPDIQGNGRAGKWEENIIFNGKVVS
jgi:hypothetical protein